MRLAFLDRYLTPLIEAALLRLSNRGDISVTVRHVTEMPPARPCAACSGSGRQPIPFATTIQGFKARGEEAILQHHMVLQGICLACRGKGVAP